MKDTTKFVYSAPKYIECHEATSFIFNWKGKKIYAGGQSRGLRVMNNSLFINLSSGKNYNILESSSDFLKGFCDKYNNIHTLNIDWPDFDIPELGRDFWIDLIKVIEELPENIPNVVIACAGGHGRTGTALSIIWGLTEGIDDPEPVEYLREIYCKKIVESREQIRYIEEMLQKKISSKERKHSAGFSGYGGHTTSFVNDYYDRVVKKDKKDVKDVKKDNSPEIFKQRYYGNFGLDDLGNVVGEEWPELNERGGYTKDEKAFLTGEIDDELEMYEGFQITKKP